MARPLTICTAHGPDELRRLARRERDRAKAARLYAIAHALEGMERGEAARLAGFERQALRDAVIRYNAEGVAGLAQRPAPGPTPKLDAAQVEQLRAWVLAGPDPERDGVSTWRLVDIAAWIERRFGQRYCPSGVWVLLRRLGLSWQKARPVHPAGDPEAKAAFEKTSPLRSMPSRPRSRVDASKSGSRTVDRRRRSTASARKAASAIAGSPAGSAPPRSATSASNPPTSSLPPARATTMPSPSSSPTPTPTP